MFQYTPARPLSELSVADAAAWVKGITTIDVLIALRAATELAQYQAVVDALVARHAAKVERKAAKAA